MKRFYLLCAFCLSMVAVSAQDEEGEEEKGFKKENLFTGGSISFSFGTGYFLVGGSPVFGYSLTKWLDAGIVANYFYSEQKDYLVFDDKLKQSVYGGGGFIRLFPVRFLFAQGQLEHNWSKVKYLPQNGGVSDENSVSGTSFLVGPGYTTGRDPDSKSPFGYFAVLWDVLKNRYSPYLNSYGRATPIIRAGINIPLFQRNRANDF
ncbi:MAG: hypothetical protein ACXWCZ_14125 [Flavisolibacter sp.]